MGGGIFVRACVRACVRVSECVFSLFSLLISPRPEFIAFAHRIGSVVSLIDFLSLDPESKANGGLGTDLDLACSACPF